MRIGTAPNGAANLCFHFEYDGGVIRVASPDEDVQLSVSTSGGVVRMVAGEDVRFGFSVPVPGTGAYVSAFPLGAARGDCVIPDNEAGARFTEVEGYEGALVPPSGDGVQHGRHGFPSRYSHTAPCSGSSRHVGLYVRTFGIICLKLLKKGGAGGRKLFSEKFSPPCFIIRSLQPAGSLVYASSSTRGTSRDRPLRDP